MMRKVFFFLQEYCHREPMFSGVLLYVLLAFVPGLTGNVPLGVMCIIRYILPGLLAAAAAVAFFDAPRSFSGFRNCAKSVLWSSPVAILCVVNVVVGEFSPGSQVVTSVLAGVSEEFLCRLMLFPALSLYFRDKEQGELRAVLFSSLLFGVAHLSNLGGGAGVTKVLFQCCYTTLGGIVIANGYRKSGSICGGIFWLVLLNLTGTLFI
ncbi:MAG: CPBP family intramembrane metalloprotease [Lachnospiraceae bacterium]|nr:CPBP family intramembrane metalloprotease [Lachnospiraceae bacterium]